MRCFSGLFTDHPPFFEYPFLGKWRQFCAWLEQQPDQMVTAEQVFDTAMGGKQFCMFFVPAATKQRQAYGLITRVHDKGWRLQAGWRDQLVALIALLPAEADEEV